MEDFIVDGRSTWKLKDLANAIADRDLADVDAACRDLNLVYALARACIYKDIAVRKERVYIVLNNAIINAASSNDARTINNVWDIWDMLRQHNWPRLHANIDDLLELCIHESSSNDESNATMLNRFVRNWLDWQHSLLFEENQAMAEAREWLCEQIETGDVDKVLAACMRLIIVTANATDSAEALGCDALDCMFYVHELAETLDEHYSVIMGSK